VWSCRLVISGAWGKLKKARPIKGLYGLAGAGPRLAARPWALLGPSFTRCRLGESWGCAWQGLIRLGSAQVARLIAARGRLCAGEGWPGVSLALALAARRSAFYRLR
jgi:hypothetical protein